MPRIFLTPKRLIIALVLIALAGLAGFGAGLKLEETQRYSSNFARSNSLAMDLVRRAEMAADYAFITIYEVPDLAACGVAATQKAEATLLTRGAVRGVATLDETNQVRCAAPPMFLDIASQPKLDAVNFLPARNDTISLGHIGELLLVRLANNNEVIIAASSLGATIYDFLPADIRDVSLAEVSLSDGETVAEFKGDAVFTDKAAEMHLFSASSNRYPLVSEIKIPETVLAGQRNGPFVWQSAACGLIGLLATGLLASLILQPRTARDDLLDAVAKGQIVPHYQPIFRLDTGQLSGCEALARWIKPDGTKVGPDRFIPVAEVEGLIGELTRQLVITCARDLATFCNQRPDFKLSINMPPDLLLTPDFVHELDQVFAAEGLPRRSVVFEVTERQSLKDAGAVRDVIALARTMGFRFALDDTGVGHNGLSNVQSLPVDFIKIDKCFVDMIDKTAESQSIVRMLVSLACELGIKTVAEGIESYEQMLKLREIGVDEGQGYLIAPALPPQQFFKLASDWTTPGQNISPGQAAAPQGGKGGSLGQAA